ncbi:hypothetical protein ROZALSC1DRAFT_24098, partial [Rozella allomycis CSF55]
MGQYTFVKHARSADHSNHLVSCKSNRDQCWKIYSGGNKLKKICIGLSKELIEQLQSRDFECDDYEFLKRLEEMNDYSVLQRLKPKRLMDFFPKQNIEKTCELCSKMIMRINFACRLDCSHIFHQACIEKYVIENGPRCPQDGNQILEEK